jgi:hypothetical protein
MRRRRLTSENQKGATRRPRLQGGVSGSVLVYSREETLKLEQDLARPFIPAERLIFRIIIRPAAKRG